MMAKLANGIVITSGDLLVNIWPDEVFFKKLLTAFFMVPSGLNPRKRLTSEETVNCENTSSMLIFSIISVLLTGDFPTIPQTRIFA